MSIPFNGGEFQNLAIAVSAYSDEAYTNAKKISGSGLVGTDGRIDTSTETYVGQMRWYKPLSPVINVASLTSATAGTRTDISTEFSKYVKTVRTHGAQQVNLQSIISAQDGLAKISRDFGETRAQDEHNSLLAILKGVAQAEVDRVAGSGTGIISYDTDCDAAGPNYNGFFVDLNAAGMFGAAATNSGDERKLIDTTAAGASKAIRLFQALGAAWKDYEPNYMYMFTTPEVMAELRTANLVDSTIIRDGNIDFQTIFGGKFRLVMTRANQGNLSSDAAVNDRSVKTTFLVGPGCIAMNSLAVPNPVEIERSAAVYMGGGTTDVWYRWGNVYHPSGYTWAGSDTAFASDTTYAASGAWTRKVNSLNLSILPIFHA